MGNTHPAGDFPAKVVDHGIGKSEKGTPYAWIKFDTFKDWEMLEANIAIGQITAYLYLSQAAVEGSLKKLMALGYGKSSLDALNDPNTAGIVGKAASLNITNELYEGKVRAKVAWINDPDAPSGREMPRDPDTARGLGIWDAALAAAQKKHADELLAAGRQAPAPAPAKDSDVPF